MKKLKILLLPIIMLLGLTGCEKIEKSAKSMIDKAKQSVSNVDNALGLKEKPKNKDANKSDTTKNQ